MFRWAHYSYLNWLLLLIPLILMFLLYNFRHKKSLNKFASTKLLKIVAPDVSFKKIIFHQIIFILIYALAVIAIANPQIGTRFEDAKDSGIDIFVLLDVSLSMKATDVKPSRLELAKLQMENLISTLKGDRVGLIVFSGEAYVQFPLTNDYAAAQLFLDAIDENTVPQHGTSISSAISMAISSLESKANDKAVVIISDGEDHEGNYLSEVEKGLENNIKFYSIGIGTKEGSHIITNGVAKVDYYGDTVTTKLDDKILKEIAARGNGKYYLANNATTSLLDIYNDLSNLKRTEYGIKRVTFYEDRYYYFLIPSVLLLIFELLLSYGKSKRIDNLSLKLGLKEND